MPTLKCHDARAKACRASCIQDFSVWLFPQSYALEKTVSLTQHTNTHTHRLCIRQVVVGPLVAGYSQRKLDPAKRRTPKNQMHCRLRKKFFFFAGGRTKKVGGGKHLCRFVIKTNTLRGRLGFCVFFIIGRGSRKIIWCQIFDRKRLR